MTFNGLKLKVLRIVCNFSHNLPFNSSALTSYEVPLPPAPPATPTTLLYIEHSWYVPASNPFCWLFTLAQTPHGSPLKLFQDFSQIPPLLRGFRTNHLLIFLKMKICNITPTPNALFPTSMNSFYSIAHHQETYITSLIND